MLKTIARSLHNLNLRFKKWQINGPNRVSARRIARLAKKIPVLEGLEAEMHLRKAQHRIIANVQPTDGALAILENNLGGEIVSLSILRCQGLRNGTMLDITMLPLKKEWKILHATIVEKKH